jgi:PPOX class probable FMN-dependent enzyme
MSCMGRHRLTQYTIDTEEALRGLIGQPLQTTSAKLSPRLNALTRQFIERSPLVCVATSDRDGNCDVSPRGDPPGFVHILDDSTLLLPERPGNRIADSLCNILRNPHVGLLFVIPGVGDTLRVNGRATLIRDAALLTPCAVDGKVPTLGVLVDVEIAYTQCSKAFVRSHLWDASRFITRASLPSQGEILHSLDPSIDPVRYDEERADRYRKRDGFY